MSPPVLHMIKSQGQSKTKAGLVITTRCGLEIPRRPAEDLPAGLTAWESDVTCPECTLAPTKGEQ